MASETPDLARCSRRSGIISSGPAMGWRRPRMWLALGAALTAGCSTEPSETPEDAVSGGGGDDAPLGGPGAVPAYYSHVKPLIDAYCARCHSDGGLAPMPLDTPESVQQFAQAIATVTARRTMPPFLAAPPVRPLQFDASLTDAQIQILADWAAAGAPLGHSTEEGAPIALDLGSLSRVDVTIAMPEAYIPTVLPDEYRCFVIDWPLEETRFITGTNVRPGNTLIAHHAAIYLIDAPYVDVVDQADGKDGKPGYPCFGGATPPGAESFPTKLVASWVPGERGSDLPNGTGIRVQPGGRIVLQMHYSMLAAEGPESDLSYVDFRVDESVEKGGGNLPFLNVDWPSDPASMSIPAGESKVVFNYQADPTESALLRSFATGVDPSQGIYVHGILPHLHKLGSRIELELRRKDGTVEPLIRIGRWDFDWQGTYRFAEPILVKPGDEMFIECEWDNSAANQPIVGGQPLTPRIVTWGEGSYDEMCASSMYITGVFNGVTSCSEFGSIPSDEGRFNITFRVAESVRTNDKLDGPLKGKFYGSIYRAEDVSIMGPLEGKSAVLGLSYELDLTQGSGGVHVAPGLLPAGEYSVLGFLDVDGNVDPENVDADQNDPVVIPGTVFKLECSEQPITAEFLLLRP